MEASSAHSATLNRSNDSRMSASYESLSDFLSTYVPLSNLPTPPISSDVGHPIRPASPELEEDQALDPSLIGKFAGMSRLPYYSPCNSGWPIKIDTNRRSNRSCNSPHKFDSVIQLSPHLLCTSSPCTSHPCQASNRSSRTRCMHSRLTLTTIRSVLAVIMSVLPAV